MAERKNERHERTARRTDGSTAENILTPERKRQLLHGIAEDDDATAANRMKAIEIDNRMAGESEVSTLAAEKSKLDALLEELWGAGDE